MKRFSLFALLIFAFTSIANAKVAIGDKFPEIQLNHLNSGGRFDLSVTKGKVVLVDFWASDCAPCRLALPKLNSIFLKLKGEQFTILGVNVDEDPNDTAHFLKEYKVDYPLLDDQKHELIKSLGVDVMPTSYLLNSKGVVRYIHRGFKSEDGELISRKIKEVLAEEKRASKVNAKKSEGAQKKR